MPHLGAFAPDTFGGESGDEQLIGKGANADAAVTDERKAYALVKKYTLAREEIYSDIDQLLGAQERARILSFFFRCVPSSATLPFSRRA